MTESDQDWTDTHDIIRRGHSLQWLSVQRFDIGLVYEPSLSSGGVGSNKDIQSLEE